MSGRIRSLKPEWLEDEGLLRAGVEARVLSASLLLLADDYGNGRYLPAVLSAQVFPVFDDGDPRESLAKFREAFERLSAMGFVSTYEVRGQVYFTIRNWSKHQKVDKPGKPRVPGPNETESNIKSEPRETVAKPSRESRESLGPDLDLDHDLDHDRDHPRAASRKYPELPKPIPDNPEVPLPVPAYRLKPDFARRKTRELNAPYMPTGFELQAHDECQVLLAETASMRCEPEETIGPRTLTHFFADEYARSQGFPIRLLRSQWSRWVDPPKVVEKLSPEEQRTAELRAAKERARLQLQAEMQSLVITLPGAKHATRG